jgi:hypothetical protein
VTVTSTRNSPRRFFRARPLFLDAVCALQLLL